jgi:hypothetical protein
MNAKRTELRLVAMAVRTCVEVVIAAPLSFAFDGAIDVDGTFPAISVMLQQTSEYL